MRFPSLRLFPLGSPTSVPTPSLSLLSWGARGRQGDHSPTHRLTPPSGDNPQRGFLGRRPHRTKDHSCPITRHAVQCSPDTGRPKEPSPPSQPQGGSWAWEGGGGCTARSTPPNGATRPPTGQHAPQRGRMRSLNPPKDVILVPSHSGCFSSPMFAGSVPLPHQTLRRPTHFRPHAVRGTEWQCHTGRTGSATQTQFRSRCWGQGWIQQPPCTEPPRHRALNDDEDCDTSPPQHRRPTETTTVTQI